jgi:hypothetical protein
MIRPSRIAMASIGWRWRANVWHSRARTIHSGPCFSAFTAGDYAENAAVVQRSVSTCIRLEMRKKEAEQAATTGVFGPKGGGRPPRWCLLRFLSELYVARLVPSSGSEFLFRESRSVRGAAVELRGSSAPRWGISHDEVHIFTPWPRVWRGARIRFAVAVGIVEHGPRDGEARLGVRQRPVRSGTSLSPAIGGAMQSLAFRGMG